MQKTTRTEDNRQTAKEALCGGFRSLGRRVGHRTADWAVEREYATFSRRLIGENMSCANATDITLRTA
ncbi:MAG: hypothetical protein MJZ81_10180, partial [Bacteroidales bacterium]|nr:hypothetical protein [Bacteroidales bacterium]